jgi:hypothetical protein
VWIPVGRDELPGAPQAEVVVAAPDLLDHQVHRAAEVTVGEGGDRVQLTEPEQPVRSPAADVGAIIVVSSDVV